MGFFQVHGVDYNDVFSTVFKFDTLRFQPAHSVVKNLELKQADVKTAFLKGDLSE